MQQSFIHKGVLRHIAGVVLPVFTLLIILVDIRLQAEESEEQHGAWKKLFEQGKQADDKGLNKGLKWEANRIFEKCLQAANKFTPGIPDISNVCCVWRKRTDIWAI